ncbi:Uncharacterized protein Adt_29563 [Abeliophyllum distichum]|uniref:Uncharacterized protein n=1 Tax=Abeliophyllum distichum TaxID=126358 RepID=A0ABD1R9U4_9LAMI
MAPKRPPTTVENRKKKAIEGTSKKARVETSDSSYYLSKEHEERFKNLTSQWSILRERRIQLEDFSHSELYNLIDMCDWSKIVETPYKIYSQLIHEFYTNFNHKIDKHGTKHYRQTWVQDKWIMFILRVINQYYRITFTDVHPLPTIQDMGEVVRFLYGRDDA